MEILHIIPANGTHIVPLANMLQRKDKENKHTFMVTTAFQTVVKNNVDLLQIRGLQCMPIFKGNSLKKKMRYLKNCAEKADHVVWHTMITTDGYTPFILYANKKLLKKSTWIPYEGEIGNFRSVSNKWKNRRAKRVNNYVQNHIRCVGLEHISDAELFEGTKSKDSIYTVLPYPFTAEQTEVFDRCIDNNTPKNSTSVPLVQLGLNSQSLNKQKALLNIFGELTDYSNSILFVQFCSALKQMRCEAGTKVNKNQVRKKASKLECKCVFKDKRMEADDYIQYVGKMDIALLGNHTSCQMHNLLCLLALNKRIFISQDSPLYDYLNSLGANVYSTEKLSELGSLSAAMELPGSKLPEVFKDYYTEASVLEKWQQWLSDIAN